MEGRREYGNGGGYRPHHSDDEVLREVKVEPTGEEQKEFTIKAISNRRGKAVRIREFPGKDRVIIVPESQIDKFARALEEARAHLK